MCIRDRHRAAGRRGRPAQPLRGRGPLRAPPVPDRPSRPAPSRSRTPPSPLGSHLGRRVDRGRLGLLQREINEGLNVVESWNRANSVIFYGKGGDIATNRRDEQETAVLCLRIL